MPLAKWNPLVVGALLLSLPWRTVLCLCTDPVLDREPLRGNTAAAWEHWSCVFTRSYLGLLGAVGTVPSNGLLSSSSYISTERTVVSSPPLDGCTSTRKFLHCARGLIHLLGNSCDQACLCSFLSLLTPPGAAEETLGRCWLNSVSLT